MSLTDPKVPYEVWQELNSILKIYKNLAVLEVYKEPFRFHRYDYDQPSHKLDGEKRRRPEESPEEIDERNKARARTKIIDLARENDFDTLATFTFDELKVEDRYDIDSLKRHMSHWINNQRRLHGKWRYIFVPEYHKKCEVCVKAKAKSCPHKDAPKAIHFHALFGGYKGNLVDSGHKDKHGRAKLDIKSYRLGIAHAVRIDDTIDDHERANGYVAKYIVKEMPKFRGRQRYWCSNKLQKPIKVLNPLLTDGDKEKFTQKFENDKKTVYEFRGQFTPEDVRRISASGQQREGYLRASEWWR